MDNTIERYYLAETAKMREIWSDAASPYEERLAALVALCEEVLDKYRDAESVIVHEQGHETDAALAELEREVGDYRERLAKLRGEG